MEQLKKNVRKTKRPKMKIHIDFKNIFIITKVYDFDEKIVVLSIVEICIECNVVTEKLLNQYGVVV